MTAGRPRGEGREERGAAGGGSSRQGARRGGFRGEAMFGFADRGRLVLENLYRGNETLVTDRRRDDLSRLGRAELQGGDVGGQRIAHSRGWESRLRVAVGS